MAALSHPKHVSTNSARETAPSCTTADAPKGTTSEQLVRELAGPLGNLPPNMVFLCEKKVALLLGLSVYTLQRDRSKSRGIPFVVIGSRTIRYRLSDVLAWAEASNATVTTTTRDRRSS